MLKKWIAVLLSLMLISMTFALAGSAEPSNAEEEMAEGADSDWYMEILDDPEIAGEFPYHCFADVNGDGVPVLIVSSTEEAFIGAEDHANVYLYRDGGAELVLSVGGAGGDKFFCNAGSHTLTHYSRLSGEEHIEVFEAKDGALTTVTKVDRYAPNHGPAGNNTEDACFQDDAEITAQECEELFGQYAGDDELVTYEKQA